MIHSDISVFMNKVKVVSNLPNLPNNFYDEGPKILGLLK